MLSRIRSASLWGIDAVPVYVEVDSRLGMPNEIMVGLPDMVVKESKNRIRAAIKNSELEYPIRSYTINLAPAELKKEGPSLDLPIAVGILQATEQLPLDSDSLFVGELSLTGDIRPIRGIVSICHHAKVSGVKRIFVPAENGWEAQLVAEGLVIPVTHLRDVMRFYHENIWPTLAASPPDRTSREHLTFDDVKGNILGKRAMEIVAAGRHNVLLTGPPGSGKTMLLKRLPTILPKMTEQEAIETYKISSIIAKIGLKDRHYSQTRPFRSPHHTTSYAGMVGGGKNPAPGEITLANHGVLFLDELPEFSRPVLEVLRQPLEEHKITLSRANFCVDYPAKFVLVAAMNPCPCGYFGDTISRCQCVPILRKKYYQRISGPILDRIDLMMEIPRLKSEDYFSAPNQPNYEMAHATMQARVQAAYDIQWHRQEGVPNAHLSPAKVKQFCRIDESTQALLTTAIESGMLTGRSFDKVLKVARTIADLAGEPDLSLPHVTEAIQFRKNRLMDG